MGSMVQYRTVPYGTMQDLFTKRENRNSTGNFLPKSEFKNKKY